MKQIEITVKVNNTLSNIDKILIKQGFKVIRKSRIEDLYLCKNEEVLSIDNIISILGRTVLIRYLNNAGKEFKKITYKNKDYENDTVISETKINVNIDSIENAEKLFKKLGFKDLVKVNYDVIVYEKEGYELAFQDVEGLGLLLEVENLEDFTNVKNVKIINIKKKMHNDLKKLNLDISEDFDIKKAYELIKNNLNNN